jgi:hypothetical protein
MSIKAAKGSVLDSANKLCMGKNTFGWQSYRQLNVKTTCPQFYRSIAQTKMTHVTCV